MRTFLLFLLLAGGLIQGRAQTEGKWLRAFPITGYMVDLDDSTKVVQLEMPEGFVIPDRELAVAYGVYRDSSSEITTKGYGRCHLIKGVYHYFSIRHNRSPEPLQAGDLLYMFLDSTPIHFGRVPQLAAHFIRLQNVYEDPFYDRYLVFNKWTQEDEEAMMDSLVADIRFTGDYMTENNSVQDVPISEGRFAGQSVFRVMSGCRKDDLLDFLDFMLENPRKYAGNTWKITEVFATWAPKNPD